MGVVRVENRKLRLWIGLFLAFFGRVGPRWADLSEFFFLGIVGCVLAHERGVEIHTFLRLRCGWGVTFSLLHF